MPRSIIQCPHCGFKAVESSLASSEPLLLYRCLACDKDIDAKSAEHCCVFCRYGSLRCTQINDSRSRPTSQ